VESRRTRLKKDKFNSESILQGLTTAVVVLDLEFNIVQLNTAAENLLGISQRQAYGAPVSASFTPPDEFLALCQRVIETGLTCGAREIATRVGDRETLLDCRAVPLDGLKGYLILELFDTERDRQIRREAELVAQRRVSRRIIKQLAHEVKNPLGGLRGAAQLLARQLPTVELKAYTKVIIEEADRLAALVDSILDAGRESKEETLNLHEVTEHVAKLIDAEKPEGVDLIRDYDPSLPLARADRSQLIQAFLNLGKNGLQAVGSKGNLIFRTRALSNYTLGGERHRLVLCAEVEDTGPGIPDELLETIFYPLVTGRPTGTGLGLTIAQDLISRNGGLIEFRSEPGSTAFQMFLPAITNTSKVN
tara:strand:- start:7884 stop:8972 length:1089 start_codon:yes stop_codon:yes gene_type:complete